MKSIFGGVSVSGALPVKRRGRPATDLSQWYGKRHPNASFKKILGAGSSDSHGNARVWAICDCGKKCLARSSEIGKRVKSCGCIKHKCYVNRVQQTVSKLPPDTIMQCFLHVAGDKDTPRPDLPWNVIVSAFYRHTEQLKSLAAGNMQAIRNSVLAGSDYNRLAAMNWGADLTVLPDGRWVFTPKHLHRAEIAWLAKRVRAEYRMVCMERHSVFTTLQRYRMQRNVELNELDGDPLLDYLDRKRREQLHADRFNADELHNPDSDTGKLAERDPKSLDHAWQWLKVNQSSLVLSHYQQGLVDWFRNAAERTFQYRKRMGRKWGEQHRKAKKERRDWLRRLEQRQWEVGLRL